MRAGKSVSEPVCERGKVDAHRIWWVQAEAVLGFVIAWEKHLERIEYRDAAV